MTTNPDPTGPALFDEPQDTRPTISIDVDPLTPVSPDPLPIMIDDTGPRPRRRAARRPPHLDWRPAHEILLRAPGGGDDDWLSITAVALHDGWATVRIEDKRGTRVLVYPAWRVVAIEMRTT
jgi:hypothetical protein